MGNYDERMPNNEETSLTMIHKCNLVTSLRLMLSLILFFLVKKNKQNITLFQINYPVSAKNCTYPFH